MVRKKIRTFIDYGLRLLATALILFIIFNRVNPDEFIPLLANISWLWVIFAISFYYVAIFLLSLRWKTLINPVKVSVIKIFKIYILGMLINTVAPATLGVDVSRSLYISQVSKNKAESFASVFMDRFLGVIAIFVLGLLGLLYKVGNLPRAKVLIAFIAVLMGLVLFIYIGWHSKTLSKLQVIKKIRFFSIGEKLFKFYESFYNYRDKRTILLKGVFISLLLQISFAFQAFCVGQSLGFSEISVLPYLFLVPLINALMFVPFTISGLGIREAGYYILFQSYIGKDEAVLLSLLYWATGIAANLPGIYYLFKNPLKRGSL